MNDDDEHDAEVLRELALHRIRLATAKLTSSMERVEDVVSTLERLQVALANLKSGVKVNPLDVWKSSCGRLDERS